MIHLFFSFLKYTILPVFQVSGCSQVKCILNYYFNNKNKLCLPIVIEVIKKQLWITFTKVHNCQDSTAA